MPKGGKLEGLLVLGKKPSAEEPAPDSEEGGDEDRYFGMAFDAAAEGDKEAFVSAIKMAVDACVEKAKAEEY